MKSKEKKFKVVSASATAIETVIKPYIRHTHQIMLEGSNQVHLGVSDFCDTLDKSSKSFSWFFKSIKKLSQSAHSLTRYLIRVNYQSQHKSLSVIEAGLNQSQADLEAKFDKNNQKSYKSWVCSSENRKLIREIILFTKEHTKEFNPLPYHKILQYFAAFTYIQQQAREQLWQVSVLPLNEFLRFGLKNLQKFSKYAVGVYGKLLVRVIIQKKWFRIFSSESDEAILKSYTSTKEDDLKYCALESGLYLPASAIAMNHEDRAIILTIRGSMSVFDWLTDLTGDYTAYDYTDAKTGEVLASGLVHKGILLCAKNLAAQVRCQLLQLQETHPSYSLVILGHSLGAGVAALLALLWMSDPAFSKTGFFALAYAPPAVVSAELNVYLKRFVFSCSYGNDIVCRMSFGHLRDCVAIIEYFNHKDHEKGSEGAKSEDSIRPGHILTRRLYKKQQDQRLLDMYKELKSRFNNHKLETPGHVYQIYKVKSHKESGLLPGTGSKYLGSFVDNKFYEEIVFGKSAFNDHFPDLYEKSLGYLVGTLENS